VNYYKLEKEAVLETLKTSFSGLTKEEAKNRLLKYGLNKLQDVKKKSKVKMFLSQFKDIMIIILILSATFSFVMSLINNESFIDSIIIVSIVIINAVLGFIQELKAEKEVELLKKDDVSLVKVKRDNNVILVNKEELVKGDIILLEAGDIVYADARILSSYSLKVDESSLTGESVPVLKNEKEIKKDVTISEMSNMIFFGTNVVYGNCVAVVTGVGMNTEFGKIATSLNEEREKISPLEKKINGISKFISIIIFIIIFIMFIIGLLKGMELQEIIMLSISLAVAAIPEGLPAIITIILSLGVSKMSKKNALVKNISSIEALGCTNIICSDKTGTITKNQMTVKKYYYNNKLSDEKTDNILFKMMYLNNNSVKNEDTFIGDPTEVALYSFCNDVINVEDERKLYKRLFEIPFDSDRKLMSTINEFGKLKKMLTKGSFDSIINRCSKILINEKEEILRDEEKEKIVEVIKEESKKSYRILAFAYKDIIGEDYSNQKEDDLVFVGLTFLIDPPRKDVKDAIEVCKEASIIPLMITGDSIETSRAIAKKVGILQNDNEAILGSELDKMSFEKLKEKVLDCRVFSRVSPINKLSIVKALKEKDYVVSMTGDGVNDAPALKYADVGVGMGITGTEVSKSCSDIILKDDSFKTIVDAVKEGRRIFDNIRNVLVYILTGNIAEVTIVFLGMIFGVKIFIPIQLLYLNLVTDSIPAIALSFEEASDDIMKRKFKKNNNNIFTPFILSKMLFSSILKIIAVLIVLLIGKVYGLAISTTMAFLTLILVEMGYAISCRNLKSNIINKNIFSNKVMNLSMFLLFLIQGIVFLTPVKNLFGLESLNLIQIIICFGVTVVMFMLDEVVKKMVVKKFKD